MASAANIRKIIRRKRTALDRRHRDQSAVSACKKLVRLSAFRNARTIALYLPENGELDPTPVLKKAIGMGKTCFLPVLHPLQQKLWFAPWEPGDPLKRNCYGIPEPRRIPHKLTPAWALDLVITPLVAFNKHGTRLGMGGGYYDRSFAYLKNRQGFSKPLLLGFGYEFQRVKKLTRNEWDIPIDIAVTDKRTWVFEQDID